MVISMGSGGRPTKTAGCQHLVTRLRWRSAQAWTRPAARWQLAQGTEHMGGDHGRVRLPPARRSSASRA